jgi:hypothetical protein
MDGRTLPRPVIAFLTVVLAWWLTGLASGEDTQKQLPDKSPIFTSSGLDNEFLGAVSIHLRVDDKAAPRRAELGLMARISKKGEKPTRYRTKVVPIVLDKTPGNSDVFGVSRMPADLIRPDETLQIRLGSASVDVDSVSLVLCGSDGNPCRDIKLTQVKLPAKPVALESEK